jgi:predicted permease
MLDRVYRLLLSLLPREFTPEDRWEMWGTYRKRVERAGDARRSTTSERLREVTDLAFTLLSAWWPFPSLESLLYDARFGIRSLAKSPLTSGLAVLSLALGIGVTSAMFSALDVWIFRPLPLPNAERLVGVGMANRARGWNYNVFSRRDYLDWAEASSSVTLGVYAPGSYNLLADGRAERVRGLLVSANLPDVLGIEPALGRSFTPEEGRRDGAGVALATDAFWRASLGGDPGAVGRDIMLDGVPHTVVGVLPPRQMIPGRRVDVWTPLRFSPDETRSGHFLWGIGLLHEAVGVEAAQAELDAVARRVVLSDPNGTFPDATVRPFRDLIYGSEYRQGAVVLAGSVLFVLLIACANIANILLARGMARTHEVAVRGSLGAGRSRIVQQLLVESLVIAVLGGGLGIAFGYMGLDLLLTFGLTAEEVMGWDQIRLNGRVMGVAGALTVLSAVLFGLAPALRASRVDFRERLAEGGRDGSSSGGGKLGSAFVVAEIAASLVLVALTGLMIRASLELQGVEMGMRTTDAVVFRVDPPGNAYPEAEDLRGFYGELSRSLAAVPGVTGVTTTSGHPLTQWSTTIYGVAGMEGGEEDSRLSAEYRRVSPSYLEVMDLELEAGRWLSPDEALADGPPAVVVSSVLARRWWGDGASAVGQSLLLSGEARPIVGVVRSGRLRGPDREPPPVIFEAFDQAPWRSAFMIVSYDVDAQQIVASARDLVGRMDPNLALFDVQTMAQLMYEAVGPQRAVARILGSLGGLALLLTLVGVYGVVAHSVGRRRHEMGLRVALGASASSIVFMVLRSNGRLAALGLALGLLLSMGAGQGVAFLLAEVSPRDPLVLALVSSFVLVTILVASWLPARRAGRVDPVETLRSE